MKYMKSWMKLFVLLPAWRKGSDDDVAKYWFWMYEIIWLRKCSRYQFLIFETIDFMGNIYAWISKTLSKSQLTLLILLPVKKCSDGDEGKHYLNINFEKKFLEVNRENINQTG